MDWNGVRTGSDRMLSTDGARYGEIETCFFFVSA